MNLGIFIACILVSTEIKEFIFLRWIEGSSLPAEWIIKDLCTFFFCANRAFLGLKVPMKFVNLMSFPLALRALFRCWSLFLWCMQYYDGGPHNAEKFSPFCEVVSRLLISIQGMYL